MTLLQLFQLARVVCLKLYRMSLFFFFSCNLISPRHLCDFCPRHSGRGTLIKQSECTFNTDPFHINNTMIIISGFLIPSVNFFISIGHLNKWVMHINSNEIPSQNQLVIKKVAYKLYTHTETIEFYQSGTKFHFYNSNTPPHVWATNKALQV